MSDKELMKALEKRRKDLLKILQQKDLDLTSGEVLKYSQKLDELIVSYLHIKTKK